MPSSDNHAMVALVSRPDLNLLVTLDVLLAEGSVAGAARRLKLSPSAMSRALARLRDMTPDFAVLDVNLGQETSIPVAEELFARSVPFVFATGYGETSIIPAIFASVPVVRKPYDSGALVAAVLIIRAIIHRQRATAYAADTRARITILSPQGDVVADSASAASGESVAWCRS